MVALSVSKGLSQSFPLSYYGYTGVEFEYYRYSSTYCPSGWTSFSSLPSLSLQSSGVLTKFGLNDIPHQGNCFSIDYTAYIKIEVEGSYTFYTTSDDGSLLYIEGNLIVNNDNVHGPRERSGTIQLLPGYYEIKVRFYERSGGEELTVSYSGPGISKREIPNAVLFTDLFVPEVNYLFGQTGFVEDGSGAGNYTGLIGKTWLIQPNAVDYVSLNFNTVDLGQGDYVKLYDGTDESGLLLTTLTGSINPGTIASSGPQLYLAFFSNGDGNVGQGFKANYVGQSTSTVGTGAWTEVSAQGITYADKVGIGTDKLTEEYQLSVSGTIRAEEVKIYNSGTWADYVFETDYTLPALDDLEVFIREHKHLPDIPSAVDVAQEGLPLGEMDALLLQKIEELTLYIIEQNERIKMLEQQVGNKQQDEE